MYLSPPVLHAQDEKKKKWKACQISARVLCERAVKFEALWREKAVCMLQQQYTVGACPTVLYPVGVNLGSFYRSRGSKLVRSKLRYGTQASMWFWYTPKINTAVHASKQAVLVFTKSIILHASGFRVTKSNILHASGYGSKTCNSVIRNWFWW